MEDKILNSNVTAKYIICDKAVSHWGKTSTLVITNHLLQTHYHAVCVNQIKLRSKKDICVLLKVSLCGVERTIAIISVGDPKSRQKECLEWAVAENADFILCACRPEGTTRNHVKHAQKAGGYKGIIWFSNFHFNNHATANKHLYAAHTVSANSIIELLKHLFV